MRKATREADAMSRRDREARNPTEAGYFGGSADFDGIYAQTVGEFLAALEEHGVLVYDAVNGVVKTPARPLAKAVERWQEEIDREWAPATAVDERAPGAAN